MAYGPTTEDRFPVAVLVGKKLIETAPHVAYGTDEMNALIKTAFKQVVEDLQDVIGRRSPEAPQYHTVLPVVEALGALTIERNPETARYSSAAYAATDRFSISHICHHEFATEPITYVIESEQTATSNYVAGYREGFRDGFADGRL